jgi:hypothetical protein
MEKMAVVSVTTFVVKPDGFEGILADIRKGKTIMEKCGARNIRLLAAMVGGEATGSIVLSAEVDDFAGWGAYLDKFLADPEGLALFGSVNTSASPVAGFQSTIWVDVPL